SLSPGAYVLLPAYLGSYTDQSLAASVTLTNGGSASANLFITNGSGSNMMSGQIYDATNSTGLGGVFVQFESGSLFEINFTDTNGNFSTPLSPLVWKSRLDADRLARRAYVVPQDAIPADLTTGSVAGVNFPTPKGNALFYGRITNNLS